MFLKSKNKKLLLEESIKKYFDIKNKNPNKTYILVEFYKKDKSIIYEVCELLGNAIKINDVVYYINDDMLFNRKIIYNNKEEKIIQALVWEGYTLGISPFINTLDDKFNEVIQKTIYLHLQMGILENKLKKQQLTKKTIIIILIAIAAIFIFIKLLGGK